MAMLFPKQPLFLPTVVQGFSQVTNEVALVASNGTNQSPQISCNFIHFGTENRMFMPLWETGFQ